MSNTNLLGAYGGLGNSGLQFRNKLINGGFDIWQRGTSQTSSGYGSVDRWRMDISGSTMTHSQQAFALGQTEVPGNPKYFSRTVVNSVAGIGNYVVHSQRIEGVHTIAGQPATLSFWAKADAPKNIAIDFEQYFGSGGSPSAPIDGIGATTIALTTSWKYYTVTVNIPSLSGKTLGTSGSDWIRPHFWFDAGSNYAARTNSLGQQSGTFDIAQVQLEAGPVATPFEHRPYGLELSLCQRYYEKGETFVGFFSTGAHCTVPFQVAKRTNPTITATQNSTWTGSSVGTVAYTTTGLLTSPSPYKFMLRNNTGNAIGAIWSADAEL